MLNVFWWDVSCLCTEELTHESWLSVMYIDENPQNQKGQAAVHNSRKMYHCPNRSGAGHLDYNTRVLLYNMIHWRLYNIYLTFLSHHGSHVYPQPTHSLESEMFPIAAELISQIWSDSRFSLKLCKLFMLWASLQEPNSVDILVFLQCVTVRAQHLRMIWIFNEDYET